MVNKVHCVSCGAAISEAGAKPILFCPFCGARQDGKNAPKKSRFSFHLAGASITVLALGLASFGVTRLLIPTPPPAPKTQTEQPSEKEMVVPPDILDHYVKTTDSLKQNPNDKGLALRSANAAYDASKFSEASKLYENYLSKFDSTDADARVDYAYTLFRQQRVDDALAQTKKALQFVPNHPFALFNAGIIYYQMHKFDEAKVWFEKCIKAAPDDPIAAKAKEIISKISTTN